MKKTHIFTLVLLLFMLVQSYFSIAENFAITGATIYTATEQGKLSNATIVVENGKISAINPASITVDIIYDAQGKIVTPGFIGSMTQIGLIEVGAVAETRDAGDEQADITFDASLAFNPKSTVIPYTRKGGITRAIITPTGGEDMFLGQAFVADLSATFASVQASKIAAVVNLGAKFKGSRAITLQKLNQKFEEATEKLANDKQTKNKNAAKDKTEVKTPDPQQQSIYDLLNGNKILLAYADRATDILALIKLKQQYQLNLILVGAADAITVAKQISEAKVTVIIGALENLPENFDSLHNALDNAAKLTAAGVNIILTVPDEAHQLYQLRYQSGNAIANGLARKDALAAITANVADAFNLDSGKIAVGKAADIVLWSDDPFELSSRVEKLWINGKQYSTESRQDKLRERYLKKDNMPYGYHK